MEQDATKTGALVAAMNAVMEEVGTLAYDSKNEHAGYRYTSIDAFLQKVRPAMARNGLVLVQGSDSSEVSDKLLRVHWNFYLYHKDGGSIGPIPMEAAASAAMGAQAYGGAQAYALKFMLRSLFLVACDEKGEDIDQRSDEPLQPRARAAAKPKTINEAQTMELMRLATEAGLCVVDRETGEDTYPKICEAANIPHLGELPAASFEAVKKKLLLTISNYKPSGAEKAA